MTYVVALQLLLLVELRAGLVDTRTVVRGVAAEGHVQVLQELVAAGEKRLGLVGVGVDTGLTVKDNDAVGEVGGHDEIVLNDECCLLGVHNEALDDAGRNDTLLGVEVGRGLVDEVDVSGQAKSENNGDTLQFTTGQVLDFLVDEVVELQGLDNIGLELRGQERLLDLLEEELADSALELGGDSLRLHADLHVGNIGLAVGLEGTSEETTESRLSSSVLSHHDENLRVSEIAGINFKLKVAERLLHHRVVKSARAVNGKLVCGLGNAEGKRLFAETQVLGGDVAVEEDVDTLTDRVRHGDDTVDGGLSVENADVVGKIVED